MLDPRRGGAWACGGLLLLALLFFHEAAFGGRAIFERDTAFWYYPQSDDVVRILSSGAWPVWHPYRSFGEPLLANLSNQILYPPAFLHFLFEPWTAYAWYVIGHLVFSGMGQYLFARRLGLSAGASFLAAGAWTASGPLLSTVNMWNHFSGATWLPWVLWAARRACDTLQPRDAALWGGVLAAQAMTGSPDASAMAALCSAAVGLAGLPALSPGARLRRIGMGALAAVFALGLAALQWLPTAELLPGSRRMNLPESARTRWSVAPIGIAGMAVPVYVKGLTLETGDDVIAHDTVRNPLLASLYLGAPMLVLAAAGLFGAPRPMRSFLAAMAGLALVGSLGSHFAPVEAVSALLKVFRHPVKVTLLIPLGVGALAGMGLDAWNAAPAPPPRRWRLSAWSGLLAGACLIAGGLAFFGLQGRVPMPFRSEPLLFQLLALTARQALLAALAALATTGLLLWRPPVSLAARLAAVVLALGELALANRPINPTIPSEWLARRPGSVAALAADGAPRGTRVYSYDYATGVVGRRYPTADVPRALVEPGLFSPARTLALRMLYPFCGRWGLSGSFEPDVLGFSPPYMQTLAISLRAAEGSPQYLRLLQMGSVGYVLALHRETFGELLPVAEVPSPLRLPVLVFRVPDPLPRVYAVGVGRLVGPDAGYRALTDPEFDFRGQVLLADGPVVASPRFAARVRLVEERPDRRRAEVDFDAPGYLVATEAYDPRWRASVDSAPAALQRANVGFQAVQVPAGRHTVELFYRPRTVVPGALLSALSLCALLGLWLRRPARHAE